MTRANASARKAGPAPTGVWTRQWGSHPADSTQHMPSGSERDKSGNNEAAGPGSPAIKTKGESMCEGGTTSTQGDWVTKRIEASRADQSVGGSHDESQGKSGSSTIGPFGSIKDAVARNPYDRSNRK